MYDKAMLSQQEIECVEIFKLFDSGVTNDLLLKTHVKKWEIVLYGCRPELYPQDRKALLTMMEFKQQRIDHEAKKRDKQESINQKMQERGLRR